MLFSRNFRLLSIFALMVAAPQVLCAAELVGDSTITSKRYVDNKIPADSTAHLLVTPQASGGNATKRAIATAGTDITDLTSSSTDANKIKIPTAYAVKQGLDGKQTKDTENKYHVSKNGAWTVASSAVDVDTTHMKKTNNTDGSVKVAIDTTKLASAGTNITGLTDGSTAADKGKLTTAYAVKEAIGTATSGMITDVSGKQDKDNNEVYKVGYNGGWANASNAVTVDTTYLKKTDNSTNGTTQVAVDSSKLASAKADITDLTSSSTDANKGKLTTAYAVKTALDDKQAKDTTSKYMIGQNGSWVNASNAVTVDTTYLKKTDNSTNGTTQVAVDSSKLASAGTGITSLTDSSAAADKGKLTTAYAVKEAIGTAVSGADISDHTVNGAPLSNEASYYYAESSTAATTVAKVVNIPSITSLQAGQIIAVKPTVTSTVASSTIKLNNFDAYPMRYNGAAITTSTDSIVWNKNYVSIFVFDGTYWQFAGGGIDNNTTYSGMTQAEITAGTATSNRLITPKLLRDNVAARPTGAAVGSATKPVYVASDGMVTEVTHELNADVPATAVFTDTTYTADEETISKDTSNKFSAKTAAVAQNGKALTTGGQVYTYAQPKTTGTIYKIGYNGTWSNLGTTLDPNATGYVADNAVTAATIANAISSAVSGADISAHTVNGAPLSNAASYYYGSGVGAAGTAAKTVTISSITTAPTEGMTIVVNPAATASTETSLTLNLNSTGAKTVKYNGSTTLTAEQSKAIWKKDVPVVFVYDGTNWLYSGKEYTAGTGISISDANAITNTGVRAVTASGTSAADGTISVNTNGESANVAVKGWDNKQTKPSSVSNGKVLTYTGTNANSNVSAKYIQVPVATGDPNDGGTLNSTNPLASIWVE